jgi:thiamine monophosphate kinase
VALALYGGKEYELVFTVNPDCVDETRTELHSVGAELIELGVVTKENDELAR